MNYLIRSQLVCLLCFALLAPAAAQNTTGALPAPTQGPATPPVEVAPAPAENPGPYSGPDTRPLTGAQTLTLGTSNLPSYFVPKVHFAQAVDSNPTFGPESNVSTLSSISGELEFRRVARDREFTTRYQGGGMFYLNPPSGLVTPRNSTFQRIGLTERLTFSRWSLLLSDEAGYTSTSTFGPAPGGVAGVVGPAPLVGGNLAGLNPTLVSSPNLLTQTASQVNNTAVVEADYKLGPRNTVTLTGNYGILRSPDGNLIESDQEGVSGGFNRKLNARDTLGVSYGFTQFRYLDISNRVRNHIAKLLYGHQLTGRLTLQLSGGGGIAQVNSGVLSESQALWSAEAILHYLLHSTDLTASYSRAVNAGSGLLLAANSDTVSGVISRRFLARWMSTTTVGYTHNSALTSADSYSTFAATTGVQRGIGPYNGIFASYSFQRQSGAAFCPTCVDAPIRHMLTVGIDWGFRPIRLE